MIIDIPSPIDLRVLSDAREWEASALSKRPWRLEFFAAFASSISAAGVSNAHVLELGSGPGFLAEHLLAAQPLLQFVALDFSGAMHELATQRLGALAANVQFIERNFRAQDWSNGLGSFDFVVTNQAVHELRHKSYAVEFHRQVKPLLVCGGQYLVCDHFAGEGGMKNDQLYMSIAEQKGALAQAGFLKVEQLLVKGGMVLHRAT